MSIISIIVPIYKVEYYLKRCVDSIRIQFFSDFELILVDDGSPDNCGEICDEYALKDQRIHVIHQENGGLSAARNAGIEWAIRNSDSQWITFIDSDDWIHPDYLRFLYKAVKETKTEISVCNYIELREEITDKRLSYDVKVFDWNRMFIDNNVLAVIGCCKLYRKELFSNLRFPIGKMHEDEFLTYKLLAKAGKIAYVPVPLYYYFQNSEGITGKKFSLKRLDGLEALEERIGFVLPLGNKELTGFCIASCVNKCKSLIHELENADWIEQDIRDEKILELRSKAKNLLTKYGIRYVPIKKYTECYDFVFPGLTGVLRILFRTLYRVIGY